jgi:hypothetical protein
MDIVWEPTWRSGQELPSLGDLIQVEGVYRHSGETLAREGFVVKIKSSPIYPFIYGVYLHNDAPHTGPSAVITRWRKGSPPEFNVVIKKEEVPA